MDLATEYFIGKDLKKVVQVGKAIQNVIAYIQRQGNIMAKRFHIDNAKEETSKEVTNFFTKRGTIQTQTAPRSFQANWTVERLFLTMFSAVKAEMNRSGLLLKLCTYAY